MIEIIKHGDMYAKRAICPKCRCEFYYTNEEIKTEKSLRTLYSDNYYHRTTYNDIYVSVNCPECGKKIYNNSEEQHVRLEYVRLEEDERERVIKEERERSK